jgi:hypothetical protein
MSSFFVVGNTGANDRPTVSPLESSSQCRKQGNKEISNDPFGKNIRSNYSRSSEKRFCAESAAVTVGVYSDHLKVSFDGISIRVDDFSDSLVHYLNTQRIPPFLETVLFSNALRSGANLASSPFTQGEIEVDLVDHRIASGADNLNSRRITLKPSSSTVIEDLSVLDGFLSAWNPNYLKSSSVDNQNLLLEIEKRILTHTTKPLVLDPSVQVAIVMNSCAFNSSASKVDSVLMQKKLVVEKFAPFQSDLPFAHKKQLLERQKAKAEFAPKFRRLSVVEEFRRKVNSEAVPFSMRGFFDKQSAFNASCNYFFLDNALSKSGISGGQVVRTLKFERQYEGRASVFITLFIFLVNSSSGTGAASQSKFEGQLRFSQNEDASSNANGYSFSFPIGNVRMVESYIACLKHLLNIQDQGIKLVSDVINPISKSAATFPQMRQPSAPIVPSSNPLTAIQQMSFVNNSGALANRANTPLIYPTNLKAQQQHQMNLPMPTRIPTPSNLQFSYSQQQQQQQQTQAKNNQSSSTTSPVGISPHLIFTQ